MEALVVRASRVTVVTGLLLASMGASHRTENFIVTAQSKALAREIGEAAERYRAELAVQWLGHTLPRWRGPCPIRATVRDGLGAGGATSFSFEMVARDYARPIVPAGDGVFSPRSAGRPVGWEMSVQGSRERVLDSVLPHEITHTIFATHFGRPLPRWADEGACTTVEHKSEKNKQHRMLYEFLNTGRGIAFNRMFAMTEYPPDILPLYSQGFSLARFLIAHGGRQKFVKYVGRGLETNDWTAATRQFYDIDSISELQLTWLDWVRQGSPKVNPSAPERPRDRSVISAIAGTKSPARPARTASPETGWYARRSAQARSGNLLASTPGAATKARFETPNALVDNIPRRVASKDLIEVPRPSNLRTSSRPAPIERQREVLMEWGEPRPFLAPSLAGKTRDLR